MLDSEMLIGTSGIVRSRDVGFDHGDGWVRVEIKRVDSDGVLVFVMDHGITSKLTGRRVGWRVGGTKEDVNEWGGWCLRVELRVKIHPCPAGDSIYGHGIKCVEV